ncbi:MAG TPA: SpoIIE family protein phosphatase [Acidothermaceae bacterium]
MAGAEQSAADANLGALRDVSASSIDFEPTLGIPWQSGLDPLTGLADRRWFLRAVAVSDGSDSRDDSQADDVGIIAVRINGLRSLRTSHGQVAADGLLLLVAEVLHGWSRGDDLAARLGVDSFGVLAHTDALGLAATAARLRTKLADAGVSATIGSAMRAAQGGASEALRTANRDVGKSNGTRRADEAAASRAIRGASAGTAAQVIQAQATGILMQWHRCGADRARLELAYQAHEMGLPVTSMARLLIAVASGAPLSDHDAAYGIDLERSTRLAANIRAGVAPQRSTSRSGQTEVVGDDGAYTPSRQMQPIWSVRPPNSAIGLLSLAGPDTSIRSEDLLLAGRYRGAANPSSSGGDWFDAFILPDGTAALVLGDVAGHDALAATTMMQLRTLLRGFAVTHEMAPSEVLRRLDVFFAHLDLDLLATAFFGWVYPDPAGGLVLRWCNAGHLPPVVVAADGETVILETRNDLLLGLGLETSRADLSLRLEAGSTLLLYSDGLIETRNADLDHGVERLRAAARSVAMLDVAELCDQLVSAMVGVSPHDDVTVLAVRIPN